MADTRSHIAGVIRRCLTERTQNAIRANAAIPPTSVVIKIANNGDPDNFFFLRGCSDGKPLNQNITKWCNKEFDDLLVAARKEADVAKRTAAYEKMQLILKEEAPDLTIAHSIVNDAAAANVTGYKMAPLGSHHFKGVDLK